MEQANDILNELRSWNSPLADMPRTMPYLLPEGYFSALPQMLTGIATGNIAEPKLPVGKTMPFDVPEGYFEQLPAGTLQKAKGRAMPHAVPEGYFEQLPGELLAKLKDETAPQKGETIPLGQNIWKQVRWAAAAMLVMGIGIGSYVQMAPRSMSVEEQLAQLPQGTIGEYVQNNIDEFDSEMLAELAGNSNATSAIEQLNDEDIIHYLNETGWQEAETIN
jgi:hypothetical protein